MRRETSALGPVVPIFSNLSTVIASFLVLGPAVARAEEPVADPFADEGESAAKPTEGTKGPAHESLVPPKTVEPEQPPPVGPIERLPPEAYPEWRTRGLYGGSLWLSGNMNGMPWPYYPKTGIGVSGYTWVDSGYETIKRGNNTEPNDKDVISQGRAVLRISPTYSSGTWYVQTQIELVGNKDQSVAQPLVADIDDLWIRTGQWKTWDIEVGRFEAFEVYHFGMGMDLNTLEREGAFDRSIHAAPDVFEIAGSVASNSVTNIVNRQSGITNLAFHLYPSDVLRLELLTQFGFDTATAIDTLGVRPAAVFDLGWLKIKGAVDYRKQFPVASSSKESRSVRGGAGAIQFVFDPLVELGVNFAYGLTDHYSPTNSTDPNAAKGDYDTAGSFTDLDVGGFLNLRAMEGLLVGVGGNYDQETDQQSGTFTQLQAFGAIQYLVYRQLFIKVVGAYARAHIAPSAVNPFNNTMESVRVRLMYLF